MHGRRPRARGEEWHELLLRRVEVDGRVVDVRVTGPIVAEVGVGLDPSRDAEIVDGHGGALLPGLHDHHFHVLATAAVRAADHPVQTGDPTGTGPGRQRGDAWLRRRPGHEDAPGLAALGDALAGCGVTGVTDATPFRELVELGPLATAAVSGALPQRVVAMSGPELAGAAFPAALEPGPVKIILADDGAPGFDAVSTHIRHAHRHGRPVAVQCVTPAALSLAVAAWQAVGSAAGDRIEHGSVIPPELRPTIAALGPAVITQPCFIAERGDRYRAGTTASALTHLYPCDSLRRAGIAVGGSTDAPYAHLDPWAAMRAAVERTTAGGAVLGPAESITPQAALRLFLSSPRRPGGPPRTVAPGAVSDLCLLDAPLEVVLRRLRADDVVWTCVGGVPVTARRARQA